MTKTNKPNDHQEDLELEVICSVDTVTEAHVPAEQAGEPEEGPEEEKGRLAQALVECGYCDTLDHAHARVAYITPRKKQILLEHLDRTHKPPE